MDQRQYPIEVPALVATAKAAGVRLGFPDRPEGNRAGSVPSGPTSCLDEVGRLLMTLTATVTAGRVGEIGTGVGVGAAWIIGGLRPGVSFVTTETEANLAAAAAALFTHHLQVCVLNDDWRNGFAARGPYDLLFADGGGVIEEGATALADLVVPGGLVVIDDLTPEELWPPSWRGSPDPKREVAFNSGLFTATEIRTRSDSCALILARR